MDADQLAVEHLAWVRNVVWRRWGRVVRHHDLEDMYQAGTVGLLEAARRFDQSRGVGFKTFATPRVFGAVVDHLRKIQGRRRQRPALSYCDELPETAAQPWSVESEVARVRAATMARLRRVMPTRLARMALMRSFDGMKLQEIGDVFGTSDSYVSKLLEPVREYVVSAIESECA